MKIERALSKVAVVSSLLRTSLMRPIRRQQRPVRHLLVAGAIAGLPFLQPTAVENRLGERPGDRPSTPTADVATVFAALSQCHMTMRESERWRIAGAIHHESTSYGYDPLFIAAMVQVESQCKPTARGTHGAVGLIQVRPETARAVAKEGGIPWKGEATLNDAATNLRLGVRYLWTLEQRFDDPRLAVAAYNLGPTRVARMARQRAQGAQYVKRVLARYKDLVDRFEREA
jgi:soluble lytic murein transglycosylase-like protein